MDYFEVPISTKGLSVSSSRTDLVSFKIFLNKNITRSVARAYYNNEGNLNFLKNTTAIERSII